MTRSKLVNAPAWLPELEKWERTEYDGIKGFPDKWVPKLHKDKFNVARNALFFTVEQNKANYQDIRSRFDYLVANKYSRIVMAIMKDHKDYDDYLFYLVDLYKAILLGPQKGRPLLVGEEAAQALHKSEITNKNLTPEGRAEGAHQNAKKADQNKQKLKEAAIKYFMGNLLNSDIACARWMLTEAGNSLDHCIYKTHKKDEKYSASHLLKRIIPGSKAEALRRLRNT